MVYVPDVDIRPQCSGSPCGAASSEQDAVRTEYHRLGLLSTHYLRWMMYMRFQFVQVQATSEARHHVPVSSALHLPHKSGPSISAIASRICAHSKLQSPHSRARDSQRAITNDCAHILDSDVLGCTSAHITSQGPRYSHCPYRMVPVPLRG
ncbi:hypothetical protein FIBSPDRAFT_584656 [Athelia psychrophila]|uniref:Uncharacterized protein n=1 Tax=Athelia psychrophila TaxID=1759441 RepID=A0A166HG83_9AGAM|nr:hypothetical protein FIBSPDRAFT_584656 [Fibularhizoctonia sp. CBS 109695]